MVTLPSEYQEVEYITSTDTTYIQTNYYVQTEKVRVLTNFVTTITNLTERDLIGNQDAQTGRFVIGCYHKMFFGYAKQGANTESNVNSVEFEMIQQRYELDVVYDLDAEEKTLTVNGTSSTASHTRSIISTNPIQVFSDGNNTRGFGCSCYSMMLFDGDDLALNLIPCYHKMQGTIGMFDLVSGTFYTNAGTGTFLKGGDVSHDCPNMLDLRRRILLTTPHLETASGTVASFSTDLKSNLKECKIHFSPIQSGTGDPSPSNARPISGWDGVTVEQRGKNLLWTDPGDWEQGQIQTGGGRIDNTTRIRTKVKFRILPDTTYTVSHSSYIWPAWHLWTEDLSYISDSGWKSAASITFTTPSNAAWIEFTCRQSSNNLISPDEIGSTHTVQLELGSTATAYEPYQGTSLTVPFPQTIYGGYVDLVKGEIVETHERWLLTSVNAETLNANYNTETAVFFRCDVGHNFETYGTYAVTDLMCDTLAPTTNSIHGTPSNHINQINRRLTSTNRLAMIMLKSAFGITEEDTLAEMKTKISAYLAENPIVVSYKLATPNVYSLTPTQLKALKGQNNIWSNANGNIEVKFWTH